MAKLDELCSSLRSGTAGTGPDPCRTISFHERWSSSEVFGWGDLPDDTTEPSGAADRLIGLHVDSKHDFGLSTKAFTKDTSHDGWVVVKSTQDRSSKQARTGFWNRTLS